MLPESFVQRIKIITYLKNLIGPVGVIKLTIKLRNSIPFIKLSLKINAYAKLLISYNFFFFEVRQNLNDCVQSYSFHTARQSETHFSGIGSGMIKLEPTLEVAVAQAMQKLVGDNSMHTCDNQSIFLHALKQLLLNNTAVVR